jgi:hypothetical protein
MLEAEKKFRRVIGYRDLAKLAVAIEGESDRAGAVVETEVNTLVTA